MDAPEDVDMYIHRVGRTARYKNKGNSLLVLDPLEESMVVDEWMQTKKIPIKKKSINPTKTVVVTQRAASLVAGDVKLHQLAKKAFTSYIRSLALLPKLDFAVQDMDLDTYATSLGLASMPNLRFLQKVSSREGLREVKNVNRKLQKLKEQIKAEKLAKKIAKLGNQAKTTTEFLSSKKRKSTDHDDDDDDSEEEDDLLVIKKTHVPQVEPKEQQQQNDGSMDNSEAFNIHEVTRARRPMKKIRVDGSSSGQGKHIVFDEDGSERPGYFEQYYIRSEGIVSWTEE